MPTFYGPSDINSLAIGGEYFDFNDDEDRFPQPAYGDDTRSLPMLTTNDPLIIAFCEKDGWKVDPNKVAPTPDELEWEERAQRDGRIQSSILSAELGRMLARNAVQEGVPITPATPRKVTARKVTKPSRRPR